MKYLAFMLVIAFACSFTWYLARRHVGESERVFSRLRTEHGASQEEIETAIKNVYLLASVADEEMDSGRLTPEMLRNLEAESDEAWEMLGKQNDLAAECLLGVLKVLEKRNTEAAKRTLVRLLETNTIPPLTSDEVIVRVSDYAETSPAFKTYGQDAIESEKKD